MAVPTKTEMSAPLAGDALIFRVNELKPASEATIAIDCGYVSENGKARLAAFKSALLDAHGLGLAPAKGKGRPLSFQVTVGSKGQIVLGGGYGELIGTEPGEQVQIAHRGDELVITRQGVTATATPIATVGEGEVVVTYDSVPERVAVAA